MNVSARRPRRGFTLVEMLVVIAIIGILVALIIPAVWQAVLAARENRIIQEVAQLQMAVESYKQQHSAYPPDFTVVTQQSHLQTPSNEVVRHLRRAFPKHQENLTLVFQDTNGNFLVPDASEVLVSWLSQLSKDPRLPITSASDRNVFFPFDESRLRDLDGDGLMSYMPPDGGEAPYVYFSAPYTPLDANGTRTIDSYSHNGVNVFPYQSARRDPNSTNLPPNNFWNNPTSFQIIAAGLDGEFGADPLSTAGAFKVFPTGTNYSNEDWDNIANFSNGKTFEDNTE